MARPIGLLNWESERTCQTPCWTAGAFSAVTAPNLDRSTARITPTVVRVVRVKGQESDGWSERRTPARADRSARSLARQAGHSQRSAGGSTGRAHRTQSVSTGRWYGPDVTCIDD